MTKVTVYLTQAAQRAAVLAGQDAHAVQTWETQDPALAARALELGATIDVNGNVVLEGVYVGGVVRVLVDRRPVSAADALDALSHALALAVVEADRRRDAERAAEDKRCAAWAARPLAERVRYSGGCYYDVNTDGCSAKHLAEHYPTALAEAQTEAERLRTAHRERVDVERVATERARERARVERDAWIAQHGSERLRRALQLGLVDKVQGSYLEERLALDRPGWRYELSDETRRDSLEPSNAALMALEAAQALYPNCELVWLRYGSDGCEALADTYLDEHLIVQEVKGGRCTD